MKDIYWYFVGGVIVSYFIFKKAPAFSSVTSDVIASFPTPVPIGGIDTSFLPWDGPA